MPNRGDIMYLGGLQVRWMGSPNLYPGRAGQQCVSIVDHIMSGTMIGTDSYFQDPAKEVSAHFGVALDGRIWQWVMLASTAWANGILENPDMSIDWLAECATKKINPNSRTVSIEHEGKTGVTMPEAQYQASLALHRYLITTLGIQVDPTHIIGHNRITGYSRAHCPGTSFPWDKLFKDLAMTLPASPPITFQGNPYTINFGFKDFFLKYGTTRNIADPVNGGVYLFGYPTSNEYQTPKGTTRQRFERMALEFDPKEPNPEWAIRGCFTKPIDE